MLPLRDKSLEALRLGHQDPVETTVYEGAIRSAKTFTSLIDWDDYVLNCPEQTFLMSGNTLGSLSRNCLDDPEYGFIAITGGSARQRTDRDGSHFLEYDGKRIYLMGGNDAASYKKARGLTIGGWYADEVNMQHQSFVENALGRSVASRLIRNIMTLNPDLPSHWLYRDKGIGIDRWGSDYVAGLYRRFHFTLDDNPAISPERREKLARSYTGVFYKRYILGLRVRGEGGCYPSFVNNPKGQAGSIRHELPKNLYRVTVGVDFGGHKSATTFNATGWHLEGGRTNVGTIAEEYITGIITPEELNRRWKAFLVKVRAICGIDRAFADSAEQILRKGMNTAEPSLHIENAMKSEIVDRVRLYDSLFAQGRGYVMHNCPKTIEAFENAVWNEKNPVKLERLDDGTTNIDSLDAAEYAIERDATALMEE